MAALRGGGERTPPRGRTGSSRCRGLQGSQGPWPWAPLPQPHHSSSLGLSPKPLLPAFSPAPQHQSVLLGAVGLWELLLLSGCHYFRVLLGRILSMRRCWTSKKGACRQATKSSSSQGSGGGSCPSCPQGLSPAPCLPVCLPIGLSNCRGHIRGSGDPCETPDSVMWVSGPKWTRAKCRFAHSFVVGKEKPGLGSGKLDRPGSTWVRSVLQLPSPESTVPSGREQMCATL